MPLLNGENLPQAEDGALAFKVSVMTIDYNLGPKREKYGETGLAELGVLEGETRTLRVFRRDAAGGLQPLAPLGADESIAPLFAPGHRVAVVGLL